MDFNKIAKTIIEKNFQLVFFIPKVTGLTIQGFKQALKRKTLKVRDLEKITTALKLPMAFWWEEEADLIALEPSISYETKKLQKENLKLKEELSRRNKTIDNLNDHIMELKAKLDFCEQKKGQRSSG